MSDAAALSRSRKFRALRSLVASGLWKGLFALHDSIGKDRFPLLQLLSSRVNKLDGEDMLSPLLFTTFLSQIVTQSSQEAASTLCTTFISLLQAILAKHSTILAQCFNKEPSARAICTFFIDADSQHSREFDSGSLVIKFLSYLLLRQIDSAAKLLVDIIINTWSLLPLREGPGSGNVGESLLTLVSALQLILNILNHAPALSTSIETDADSDTECLWREVQELVQHYQVLRYLGGLVLRLAILFLSLSSPKYAQVTFTLLCEESQVDYNAHLQHIDALGTKEKERCRNNSRVRGLSQTEQTAGVDEGFKYLRTASKEECDDYLCGKPTGTFVVRLSASSAPAPVINQQMYLCFRADPQEKGQENEPLSPSIKHAVIRREEFGADVVMYRCGSVGPFPSLSELLTEISNRLPSPLLFNHSPPSVSPSASGAASVELQCRDLNSNLWSELRKLLPILVLDFGSSLHAKRGEGNKKNAASNEVLSTVAVGEDDDESKATAVTEDDDDYVGIQDKARPGGAVAESMGMWLQVLRLLALQMFSRQNEPLLDLLQRLFSMDVVSVRADAAAGDCISHQQHLKKYSNIMHLKSYFLSSSMLNSNAMAVISNEGTFALSVFSVLYDCVNELESRVKSQLLSTPDNLLRRQRYQNEEREPELLAAERLLQLLIRKSQLSFGSDIPLFKPVRFSLASSAFQESASAMGYGIGTSGTFVLTDCCDATELLHTLNRYVFELIMLLQPERMSPLPKKNAAGDAEKASRWESKYSNHIYGDDSEDEMAMHFVDPGRVSNDDSDSDNTGVGRIQLPDTPIDFTSLSPASPNRKLDTNSYNDAGCPQADTNPEEEARVVMQQNNSPFIMIQQQGRSRGSSNTNLVEQAFEEKRLGRTGGVVVGKKNMGELWHGYVDKVKSKFDKISTNLKASQQSNVMKASLLNSNSLLSRAPSVESIQRDVLQALTHVLDVLNIDPVHATSHVNLDNPSGCFVVTEKVVELMLLHGLLVQIVKPSELAFGVPQSFYHYVDAFESNVVQDHTTLNERCKIGRHFYTGVNMTSLGGGKFQGQGQSYSGSVAVLLGAFATALEQRSEFRTAEVVTHLANFLKIDDYVLQTVSQADKAVDVQRHATTCVQNTLPPYSDVRHTLHRFYHVQQSTYFLTLELCLFRNSLFRSLRLNYRLVALLQVDVYHLKEVLAVVPPRSKPASTLPLFSNSMHFNSQAGQVQLCPVHQMHTQSLEVYGTFRLSKKLFETFGTVGSLKPGQQPVAPVAVERSSSNSLLSEGLFTTAASAANQYRYPSESSSVSPMKRLEATRPATTSDSHSKAAAVTQQLINGSILLPQVTHSSDYDLRVQSLFRLPFPDHLSTLGIGSDRRDVPDLQSLPYSHLTVSIFEKTFFSDVKVGEVDISLLDLGEKNVVRDWFPLCNADGSGKAGSKPVASWLVFMQVKMRQVMMRIDNGSTDSGTARVVANMYSAPPKDTKDKATKTLSVRKGGNLLGQLEDFF